MLFSGVAVLLLVFAEGYRFDSSVDRTDHVFAVAAAIDGVLYIAVKNFSVWWLIPQWILSIAAATYIVSRRRRMKPPRH